MTVPEAVDISKKHLVELLPELRHAEIRLEELDVPPYGNKWKFTFSAMSLPSSATSLGSVLRSVRIAKSVEIDPESGSLLSMKNAAA